MIFFLILVASAHAEPAPFEMPLHALKAYFTDGEKDANPNPFPYDSFGAPPDHYPAIIPENAPSDYYEDNASYPGIYDDKECHSVRNCPGEPDNPYAPAFLQFGFNPKEARSWKCNVEVDCFGLDEIPGDLSNDTEVLFLRSFGFHTLEAGNLSVAPPLIKLRIEYSDLKTVEPGAFASQSTLQFLEIIGNFISKIAPATFIHLAELKYLDLTGNKITEISQETFEGLDALIELRVSSNSLSFLADNTFSGADKLEQIFLEDNNITTISKHAFSGLPKLKTLYLSHNKLTAVPTVPLREPTALRILRLSGNPLKKILRNDFKGLGRLEELWLDGCDLKSIKKRAFQSTRIQVLVLAGNSLTNVPNLGWMRRLRTIRMDFNPWMCNCEMLRTVKWLRDHTIGSESEDPRCAAPEHLAGRRALELTPDDLCSPPRFIPAPPTTPLIQPRETERYPSKETEINAHSKGPDTDSDYEIPLPDGGWVQVPYDTKKLYTMVDSHMPNSTAPQGTTSSRTTQEVVKTEVTKKDTRILHSTRSPLNTRENIAATIGFSRGMTSTEAPPDKGTSVSPPVNTTEVKTEPNSTAFVLTTRSKGTKPPGSAAPTYVFPVSIVVILLSIVLVVVLAKQWQARKIKKLKAAELELTPNDGEIANDTGKGESSTDQNGDASPKPPICEETLKIVDEKPKLSIGTEDETERSEDDEAVLT